MGQEDDAQPMESHEETKVYKRRYLMVIMFILLSASNALQWIEYSIIAHIFTEFYGVSYDAVNWTSMIYMLMYMLLVFPGSWFLDKYGLRVSILIGAFGNCFGAWLKILSTHPDKFWLTFVAQTVVGSSQVFILGIPPQLAATWFGPEQVSTACSAGVFGNQLGIALGFLLPPWLVHEGTKEEVAFDLSVLFLISAVTNTFVFVLIVLFFKEKPKLPPSLAQVKALETVDHDFLRSIKELCLNRNYMLLLITYVSTLLSQMVLFYHEGAQEATGTIGLLIVVAGMFGSVHMKHRGTTLVVYILSFAGMVLFTVTLSMDLWITFVVAALLGFFMTGYLPIGFEFAAELTFPTAEGTTSGLLNGSAQVFGVLMTTGMGKVMYSLSIFWCNALMSSFLFVGCILTDLRRQRAHKEHEPTAPPVEQPLLEQGAGEKTDPIA